MMHEFDEPERLYGDSEHFEVARPLFVNIDFYHAKTDGYIDGMITVVLDEGEFVKKAQQAAPVAIHALFRPVDCRDLLPRDDPISRR